MRNQLFRFTSLGVISLLCRPIPSIAFVPARNSENTQQCGNSKSALNMASDNTAASSSPEVIRVLALHGSEGDAQEFPNRLAALNNILENKNLQLDITAVQGPFEKGSGYSWWTMPPGVRSFNAKEYGGFEESAQKILEVWENGDFDLVLGHSQGAILVAALLALKRQPYHPKRGYVMNGVSFPNPYSKDLEILKVDDNETPSVLFIMGRNDKITPNASGEQLRDGLERASFQVASCYHEGGHGIPQEKDPDSLASIAEWIQKQANPSNSRL